MNLSLVLYTENNIETLVIRKCLDKRLLNCKSRCKNFDNGRIRIIILVPCLHIDLLRTLKSPLMANCRRCYAQFLLSRERLL